MSMGRFKTKHTQVLEWPSQSPNLNPFKNQWYDLETVVHKCSLTEHEQFCTEEWAKKSVYMCKTDRDALVAE